MLGAPDHIDFRLSLITPYPWLIRPSASDEARWDLVMARTGPRRVDRASTTSSALAARSPVRSSMAKRYQADENMPRTWRRPRRHRKRPNFASMPADAKGSRTGEASGHPGGVANDVWTGDQSADTESLGLRVPPALFYADEVAE